MVFWLCCLTGILTFIIFILIIKICLLKKSADEIADGFAGRAASDTNTLIGISSRDRHMRKLADTVNKELLLLQDDRRRFQQGDQDLKNAVTNISHDLRTPLTAICGYLDLLDREETSDTVSRYLKIIRGRTENMRHLTEELFRYSVYTSVSGGIPDEPVVLNRCLEDSISALYAALKQKHITPEISMPEQKITRLLNRNALSRIFGNIISNAVKYSDGDLVITLDKDGVITFANHASALDEIRVGRLFDRFYTVESASADSTGLGLSIAKVLTEQMGGEISAEYEDGMIRVKLSFPKICFV